MFRPARGPSGLHRSLSLSHPIGETRRLVPPNVPDSHADRLPILRNILLADRGTARRGGRCGAPSAGTPGSPAPTSRPRPPPRPHPCPRPARTGRRYLPKKPPGPASPRRRRSGAGRPACPRSRPCGRSLPGRPRSPPCSWAGPGRRPAQGGGGRCPQTARLFAAIGLPVNLRGLAFSEVRSQVARSRTRPSSWWRVRSATWPGPSGRCRGARQPAQRGRPRDLRVDVRSPPRRPRGRRNGALPDTADRAAT